MEAVTGHARTLPPVCVAAARLDSRCSRMGRRAKVSTRAVLAQPCLAPEGPYRPPAGPSKPGWWTDEWKQLATTGVAVGDVKERESPQQGSVAHLWCPGSGSSRCQGLCL